MSSSGSPSASRKRDVHVSPSAAVIPFNSPLRQSVREGEHRRSIDADDARTALVDDGLEHLPLLVSPQLGLLTAAHVRVGRLVSSAWLRTRPPATSRQARCARRTRRRASRRPTRTCRRRRRSSGGARRTSRVRRSRRTRDPRRTRASARPRDRCRASASTPAGTCRGAARSHSCCSAACSRSVPNGRSSIEGSAASGRVAGVCVATRPAASTAPKPNMSSTRRVSVFIWPTFQRFARDKSMCANDRQGSAPDAHYHMRSLRDLTAPVPQNLLRLIVQREIIRNRVRSGLELA